MVLVGRLLNLFLATLGVMLFLLLLYLLDLGVLLVTLHDAAHVISLSLALSLMAIAFISYLRDGRRRYLLLSGAFTILVVNEGLSFLSASFIPLAEPVVPLIGDPVSHWLNLAMVTLLFTGLIIGDER